MIPSNAPIFGGHPVNPECVPHLEKFLAEFSVEDAAIIKRHVAKGWTAGKDSLSGDTHTGGYCIDFGTSGWSDAFVQRVVLALQRHGFEAVLRIHGEYLGANVARVGAEHIHCALSPHANAPILARVTKPGGMRYIETELKKR
jgi:hypothetical protein